ncbi:MAG: hypothetical protein DHS20C13_00790 [Thermodesulfobacteriota bacterium]|nr:MAG: hypothetical protein DHS20C13_00790 [Thermodesulfobacteriota bacterium]
MDIKLRSLLTGLIVFSIALGFGSEGFTMDQYGEMVVAQSNHGEQSERGKRRGPPPEAVEACEAQSVGDTCAFISPKGDSIAGVCEIMRGDVIACLPDNRPPHDKGKPGGAPSSEEFDN